MKTRTRKIYLGVTNSGVVSKTSGEGFEFVKSKVPLVGYFKEEYKEEKPQKVISCGNTFNRTLYHNSKGV
jgi:hypothetical protein